MISLCSTCNSRFEMDFPEGNCHLCEDSLDKLDSLLSAAESAMRPEWKTFSLSTSIPRKLLAKEEDAFDYSAGESLKSWLNARISAHLEKATGKQYSPIGAHGRIHISLISTEAKAENEPLFIFGRYKKLATGICQSKWVCMKCKGSGCKHCNGTGKMYDESVEELISGPLLSRTGGKSTFHASGREDIDVLNFAGRPFILQITKPTTPFPNLEKAAKEINAFGKIEVVGLKFAPRGSVKLVSDSHFPKTYRAWISSKELLTDEDAEKLASFDQTLNQRTPERVAHRRADKVRKRHAKVLSAEPEGKAIRTEIRADPGTYIKELIHGDKGRTTPSFSSFLGKECVCDRLDVVKIEDDFLDLVLA